MPSVRPRKGQSEKHAVWKETGGTGHSQSEDKKNETKIREADDEMGREIRGRLHFEENVEVMSDGTEISRQREGMMKIGKGETGKNKIGNLTVGVQDTSEISGTEF